MPYTYYINTALLNWDATQGAFEMGEEECVNEVVVEEEEEAATLFEALHCSLLPERDCLRKLALCKLREVQDLGSATCIHGQQL